MTSVKLWRHKGGWRSMPNDNEYKYSVVEFLQRPPPGFGKYVCVPSLWIKTRRETDQKVGVQFPAGKKAEIETLVLQHEKDVSSMNWPEYLCELKYNTQSHDDAKIYIMMKQIDDSKKGRSKLDKKPQLESRRHTIHTTTIEQSSQAVNDASINSGQAEGQPLCNLDNILEQANVQLKTRIKPEDFLNEAGVLLSETAKKVSTLADLVISYAASIKTSSLRTEDVSTAQAQEEEEEEEEDTSDECENPRKRPLFTFKLPPEYDDNDTRWTLKHREPSEDLIEIMTDSEVYVEKTELNACLTIAQNAMQLTRYLLLAIFNESALKTCSITGCKAFGHKIKKTRPALDKVAKDAMLHFIEIYGDRMGWPRVPKVSLNACIRNKLTDIRKKYSKRVKIQ